MMNKSKRGAIDLLSIRVAVSIPHKVKVAALNSDNLDSFSNQGGESIATRLNENCAAERVATMKGINLHKEGIAKYRPAN